MFNSVIKNNEQQINKDVWTHNSQGEQIIICESNTDNDEGKELVANTINELLKDSNYKDFCCFIQNQCTIKSDRGAS